VPDRSDARRDRIHALLQELGPSSEGYEGALLTGWVVLSSWVDTDGETWLAMGHAAETPRWTAKGMMHEALFAEYEDEDD
jgi:hypothetical protein